MLTASLSDGLSHELSFAVKHEDGEYLITPQEFGPLDFRLNPHGRQMRAQVIMELHGLVFPAFGDYEVVLLVDGIPIASAPFYVDQAPSA
ncbi:MAG: hypothetical protein HEQ38_05060 [Gemmatimonas sp.]|nr:hypothetical protein [Gemmatimonas sp.]